MSKSIHRPWDNNLPWVRVSVFIHGFTSVSDSAGSMVITALTSWLAWAAVCPAVVGRGTVGGTIAPPFHLLSPPPTWDSERSGSSVQLRPLASNVVSRLALTPYSCFTVSWATVWLSLNYCIWNQFPNCAAKNTPSNQIIVMWVDELFLYTVLVANKSLNPFRKLEKKARVSSAMSSSLLVFFQKEEHTYTWNDYEHVNIHVHEHTGTKNLLTVTSFSRTTCLEQTTLTQNEWCARKINLGKHHWSVLVLIHLFSLQNDTGESLFPNHQYKTS